MSGPLVLFEGGFVLRSALFEAGLVLAHEVVAVYLRCFPVLMQDQVLLGRSHFYILFLNKSDIIREELAKSNLNSRWIRREW